MMKMLSMCDRPDANTEIELMNIDVRIEMPAISKMLLAACIKDSDEDVHLS